MDRVEIMPLQEGPDPAIEYDILIYCIGYERRSRFIADKLRDSTRKFLAFCYENMRNFSFKDNLKRAIENEHDVNPVNVRLGLVIAEKVRQIRANAINQCDPLNFAIDISSMDRKLMGEIYIACIENSRPGDRIDILYAPAEFKEPELSFLPVHLEMPVLPQLRGTIRQPHIKSTMVVGLGYEYGVALGVIEKFEPDQLIVFRPGGTDPRFDTSVNKANFDLDFSPNPVVIDYDVKAPYQLFYDLYDITRGLVDHVEVVIVPAGPKIFSMAAIIVGLLLSPRICVWRVSLASAPAPGDVIAEGHVYGFSVAVPRALETRLLNK